jgi:hypothetical protein
LVEWIGILGKVKGKESQKKKVIIKKETRRARKYVSI